METTTYSGSKEYTLNPGESQVKITLISADASFSNTSSVTEFNYGQVGVSKPSTNFTVYSQGEYVLALIETQYSPVTGPPVIDPPSYCHIYFKPEGTNWLWSTNAQTDDNPSIFPNGQGERNNSVINIQSPTEQNPASIPSTYPNLNSELVFLLDKNANGNLLFRGNEPLKPGKTGQDIDFQTLHNCLKAKYQLQTGSYDFPGMGDYILRDIAFLSPNPLGEGPILLAEIGSFGATETSQVDQKWYPETPGTFSKGMKGQVSNWNVEPASSSTSLNVEMVNNLSEWMNTPYTDPTTGATIPVVYYIHCSSGHDRTGMISSGYLMRHYGLGLSEAFILGTTIHKLNLNYGGNLVTNCEDIFGDGTVDPIRSRCFVAGTAQNPTYNDAVVNIYNSLNYVNSGKLSSKAVSGDPAIGNTGTAYVYSHYPWNFPAVGYAAMVDGIVASVGVIVGGCGYSQPPTVSIEAPAGDGITATATAEVNNGIVTGVTMTNQGSGYDNPPQVTFSSPE